MIHMPDSTRAGSVTYDTVCLRFAAKEIGTVTQKVLVIFVPVLNPRERKTMIVGVDVNTSGAFDTGFAPR